MIPIGDSNPLRRAPVMNWLLIVANVLVFLYELTLTPRGWKSQWWRIAGPQCSMSTSPTSGT